MKIKKEHFEHMKQEIESFLEKYPTAVKDYEEGRFVRSEKVKDLQKRFCWDMSYHAGLGSFLCDELYQYMDDSHYYTALKSICPKVVRKY